MRPRFNMATPRNHIDFETYSEVDLPKVGSHRYAVDPSTESLCIGVSMEIAPGKRTAPVVIDLSKNPKPEQLRPLFNSIERGDTIVAHNAEFERSILGMMHARHGWPKVRRSQFDCTAARASAAGLPRSLNNVAARLNLGVQKNPEGPKLMRMFSMPQKDGSRILPSEQPEQYARYMNYCHQDVIVETMADERLPALHPFERQAFLMDSLMNDRGYPIDVALVRKAVAAVDEFTHEANTRVRELTGGLNATQRNAVLEWLQDDGADIDTLQAQEVSDLIKDGVLSPEAREILELRLETSRAGLKKLRSMLACVCPDDRVRGTILFYGAHTGRWSGVKVQPHNFARSHDEQDLILNILDQYGADGLRLFYSNPLMMLSKCMRGFIATAPGRRLVIADYTAIELYGLTWLAGETRLLEKLRAGEDLYKWLATLIYNVDLANVTSEQRRIGKNTILGCQYQLGPPGFVKYLANANITVSESFAQHAVGIYRGMVPNIREFWKAVDYAAKCAVYRRGETFRVGRIQFIAGKSTLRIILPSGRPIVYQEPYLNREQGPYGPQDVLYFHTLFRNQWVTESTYGGKLTENITQGMCCDLMVNGMLNAEQAGFPVCITVHDELGCDMAMGQGDLEEFQRVISKVPQWAQDLPLRAKGYEARRYRKD